MPTLRRASFVRLLVVASLVGASLGTTATPIAAGEPAPCQAATTKVFPTLQQAVDSIGGDMLAVIVVKGTCVGTTTINKDLTIRGQDTALTGRATLTGNGTSRVLTIAAGKVVTISDVTIRDGFTNAPNYPASAGGGIRNNGTLTLNYVTVKRNRAARGAGISSSGKLTINGSRIALNVANSTGGGIDIDGVNKAATLTINGTKIDHNRAYGGGGINSYGAVMTLNDVDITDNAAVLGGGIAAGNVTRASTDVRNKMTLTDVWMATNTAESYGAAINAEGVIILAGSTLIEDHEILSSTRGGVVEIFGYDWALGTEFVMKDTSLITENVTAGDSAAVVIWRDCGRTPPVTTGVPARVRFNTVNTWTRTGTDGC